MFCIAGRAGVQNFLEEYTSIQCVFLTGTVCENPKLTQEPFTISFLGMQYYYKDLIRNKN